MPPLRRPLIVANWKLHGSPADSVAWASNFDWRALEGIEVLVCPPYPFIGVLGDFLNGTGVVLSAQNLSEHDEGAFTGEVSGRMLKESGCRYVIVGHSERRSLFGDTDAQVAARLKRAVEAGLVPILCVGETSAQREAGETETLIARQIDAAAPVLQDAAGAFAIAYEPVWAIGTGVTATPEQAQQAQDFIRAQLHRHVGAAAASVRIVYGGSIKPDNAASLFAMPDVDGGLVGGASLKAEDFAAICRASVETSTKGRRENGEKAARERREGRATAPAQA